MKMQTATTLISVLLAALASTTASSASSDKEFFNPQKYSLLDTTYFQNLCLRLESGEGICCPDKTDREFRVCTSTSDEGLVEEWREKRHLTTFDPTLKSRSKEKEESKSAPSLIRLDFCFRRGAKGSKENCCPEWPGSDLLVCKNKAGETWKESRDFFERPKDENAVPSKLEDDD